ncbi:MAG TPA: hypothetical protein VIU34_19805, partial [Steroidobacter sp.]
LSVEEFQTKLYVIAEYAGSPANRVLHWWDDTLITTYIPPPGAVQTDPDDPPVEVPPPPVGQTGASPKASVRLYFYTPSAGVTITDPNFGAALQFVWLGKPGTKWKFSGSTQDAWSLIVTDRVDSAGRPNTTVVIPKGNVDNVALIFSDKINNGPVGPFGVKAYASASGTQMTIYMDEVGTRFNGWTILIGGFFDALPGQTLTLSGGLDRETTALLAHLDTVNPKAGEEDDPLLLGTYACAHNLKMYTVNGSKLNISMLKNPYRWDDNDDAIGTGFIEMDMVAEGTPILISLADYQDSMVLFGLRHIFIYRMDEDPDLNFKKQILHHTGLCAPHAQVAYGEGEVMYLDRSGIRSLRTRSGVEQAYAADMGTLIDSFIRAKLLATPVATRFRHFWADVEPRSGRLWMALHDVIWVLSYFPSNKVSAWTYYNASAYPIDYLNSTDDNVYWRSGNTVLSCGGDNGDIYDATEAMARVPYIDASKPASSKNWIGVDVAVQGTWQIKASFDPTNPTALDLVANVTKSTYAQQKIAVNGESPAISLEFRSTFVGPARIGNAAVHYTDSTAD